MNVLKTNCPECAGPLDLPRDFNNVICGACGAAFRVREHKGAINLSLIMSPSGPDRPSSETTQSRSAGDPDARLAQIDDAVAAVTAEIDEVKSREQSVPLQLGCGMLGIFWLVIFVIALFMTLAKSYFGGWLFYSSLAAVITVGVLRLRRQLAGREPGDQLRQERARLQEELSKLESERDILTSRTQAATPPDDSSPEH